MFRRITMHDANNMQIRLSIVRQCQKYIKIKAILNIEMRISPSNTIFLI